MGLIAKISPRLTARIAGVLYLLIFVTAPSGAATATPAKMLVNLLCDTGVALLFYVLFKPVSKTLSSLAAIFRLIFVAIMAFSALNYLSPLVLGKGHHSAAAFNSGYMLAMVPFGFHCLLIGFLIFRSAFLPRILCLLMALAGLGYLFFLWPPLGARLFFPYLAVVGILGEGSLTLWLLVMGVNSSKWNAQSSAG